MTKCILPLVILFLSLSLHSQITIMQDDMPLANDTLRYSFSAPLPALDFSQTGEDFTWDYTEIGFQTQGLEEYKSVSSVNFLMGFLFGSGTIAQQMADLLPIDDFDIDFDNLYAVFRNNSQGYARLGFFLLIEGLPLPLRYTNEDYIYRYPLNFGDQDSTSFGGSISLGDTLTLHSEGYRINQADGWGTIHTPYGSFETLRIKTTLFEYDSLYLESLPAPIALPRTTKRYTWLAKNEKLPIMEATYVLAPDGNYIPTGIRYRDIFRIPEEDDPVDEPVADFTASTTEAFPGDNIVFFNHSTPGHNENSYVWSFDPSTSVVFQNNTTFIDAEPQVSLTEPGSYTVSLLAVNSSGYNLQTRSEYIEIVNPATHIPLSEMEEFIVTLYQKEQTLIVLFNDFTGSVSVFDLHGRRVVDQSINQQSKTTINISHLAPAPYLLVFSTPHNKAPVAIKRFIRK